MPCYHPLTASDDAPLAALIRRILRDHGLAIPGTAYYDEALDHLSEYYLADPRRRAYLVLRDGDALIGGVGVAELPQLPACAELQKLYLAEAYRGRGLGRELLARAEAEALRLGYRQIYLETHTNLAAALRLYHSAGYREIPRPAFVVHSTMDRFYLKPLRGAALEER